MDSVSSELIECFNPIVKVWEYICQDLNLFFFKPYLNSPLYRMEYFAWDFAVQVNKWYHLASWLINPEE